MSRSASRRSGAVDPFIVMDVMAAAAEKEAAGDTVIHLEVGQPSTPAPKEALIAAHAALDSDRIGYVAALGLPALRERIARHYRDTYGCEVSPERVIVTTGSSGGFPLAFLASFDAGDRVALAAPGYPAYRNILAALDLEAVDLPTSAADRFQPTVEALEKAGPIVGLIVASPSNPTGTMVTRRELAAIAEWCERRGVRLISDEIYHGIVYEGEAVSAAEVSEQAIVVNSFSKYFSMTGWRVGWLVVPPELVRPIERLSQNFFISVPTLSQHAAIAAFDCRDELDGHVRRYRANRDLLLAGLPAAGLDRLTPAQGAFYLYADISHLTNDSRDFCKRMLQEAGVATTPGVDFDRLRGAGTLRISFAGSTPEMEEAVRRLKAWRMK
ncbi:pyridoxal phosphate-dependent aminotransferase [Enhydrobacter sp.]|jgi:aspartate/methionine/tyrosine aminotransferase|uniref:pyridoxal phosphate-dependent aminotransferase n=1 Tax=Enhydrobacter sp. TaxID=1894999 RepID=UPI00260D68E5|nr:pyridoxal phosphate-dependent aminotransferase [Enhydrobacter sp.]WIM13329.1 MAG: Valine--pyruvate aminotransferase [Enhydrobacter sp.]